jgi:uncharacterized membrane protein required for colicin V production
MTLIDIIAAVILFFSFIGGLTQGAVKSFFSLLCFIISVPIAGRFYTHIANLLVFLPGPNLKYIAGFFITLALAVIVLSFIFYFPRKITEESWDDGILFHLVGGVLNLLGAAVGFLVLALILNAFPVWDWLQQSFANSAIFQWLIANFSFVQTLLPEILRGGVPHTF